MQFVNATVPVDEFTGDARSCRSGGTRRGDADQEVSAPRQSWPQDGRSICVWSWRDRFAGAIKKPRARFEAILALPCARLRT